MAAQISTLYALAAPEPNSRIVGGTPISIQEFPYVASFQYHYVVPNIFIQRCVGSIISSYHVLTTAFCFTGAILSNMKVRAGSTNSLSGGQVVDILFVTNHFSYQETPRQGDIAIATLAQPLFISDTVNVLFIPPQGTFLPDGTLLQIISWGFESESGPQIDILKSIYMNKMGIEECQYLYSGQNEVAIIDSVICSTQVSGYGMCLGDSGAPMVIDQVVVGLSSYYRDCGSNAYPDIFTRIDRYTNWIMDVASAPGRAERAGNIIPVPVVRN